MNSLQKQIARRIEQHGQLGRDDRLPRRFPAAAKGVQPLKAKPDHGHGHSHDRAAVDPHAWQDIANAKGYVANIRAALVRLDPAGADAYRANTAAYLDKLDALEREVRAAIESIPLERRKVITSHDAFGYFAKAYGVQFIAPQGASTNAE